MRLGYTHEEVEAIVKYVDEKETIEGAPDLKPSTCRCSTARSSRRTASAFISYKAHLKMMAAVQPFLSGAISKTVNMPTEATVDEIMQTYIDGWKMGLKAVAIYRDGSKRTQPLNTSKGRRRRQGRRASAAAGRGAARRSGGACRRRASRSRTSSRWPGTRAT